MDLKALPSQVKGTNGSTRATKKYPVQYLCVSCIFSPPPKKNPLHNTVMDCSVNTDKTLWLRDGWWLYKFRLQSTSPHFLFLLMNLTLCAAPSSCIALSHVPYNRFHRNPAARDCCINLKPLTRTVMHLSLNQMCINDNNWKWTLKYNKWLLLRFVDLFCALGNCDVDAGSILHSSCETGFACDDVKKFPEGLCAIKRCLVYPLHHSVISVAHITELLFYVLFYSLICMFSPQQ